MVVSVDSSCRTSMALILWVFIAALCIGASSDKPSASNSERPPLNIKLKTDRSSYALTDHVTVTVALKNVSRRTTYLYAVDWGESASLSLWLKDAESGVDIVPAVIPDALPLPPTSKDSFLQLAPAATLKVAFTATLADLGIARSGKYRMYVDYHGPFKNNGSFGLSIWSREDGNIRSNSLTIEVSR